MHSQPQESVQQPVSRKGKHKQQTKQSPQERPGVVTGEVIVLLKRSRKQRAHAARAHPHYCCPKRSWCKTYLQARQLYIIYRDAYNIKDIVHTLLALFGASSSVQQAHPHTLSLSCLNLHRCKCSTTATFCDQHPQFRDAAQKRPIQHQQMHLVQRFLSRKVVPRETAAASAGADGV